MIKEYLEIGEIVGTHGIRGELRLNPWCDSPDFASKFKTLYYDNSGSCAAKIKSSRPHGNIVLLMIEGIDSVEKAQKMRGKVLYIKRSDAKLPKGSWFIQDILGLPVYDEVRGEIGTLKEVLDMPAGALYIVVGPKGEEHMIPGVPEFIKEIDPEAGRITVALIEGM